MKPYRFLPRVSLDSTITAWPRSMLPTFLGNMHRILSLSSQLAPGIDPICQTGSVLLQQLPGKHYTLSIMSSDSYKSTFGM